MMFCFWIKCALSYYLGKIYNDISRLGWVDKVLSIKFSMTSFQLWNLTKYVITTTVI